jgi:hypothetical protein
MAHPYCLPTYQIARTLWIKFTPTFLKCTSRIVLLAAGRPVEGLTDLDRAIAWIDEPGIGFLR